MNAELEKLIENGRIAISLGIEDIQSYKIGREYSAVRNFTSGVLLLLKAVLWSRSTKSNIYKDKNTTVYLDENLKRLKALNIEFKKDDIDRLKTARNAIEHLFAENSRDELKTLIGQNASFIREIAGLGDFLLSDVASASDWVFIEECEQKYLIEKGRSQKSFQLLDWPFENHMELQNLFRCDACYSDIVVQTDYTNKDIHNAELRCVSCKRWLDFGITFRNSINSFNLIQIYETQIGGGEPSGAFSRCLDCESETKFSENGVCYFCPRDAMRQCSHCQTEMSIANYESGTFGFCEDCGSKPFDD